MLIVFVCLPLSMSVATVHVACSTSLYITGNNILVSLITLSISISETVYSYCTYHVITLRTCQVTKS